MSDDTQLSFWDFDPHKRICSVDGCGRERTPGSARGFCGMHYQRWIKTGDVGSPFRRGEGPKPTCSVFGCGQSTAGGSRGFCNKHYRKWQNHGDPLGGAASIRDRDDQGRKRCYACNEWLDEKFFTPNSSSTDGRRGRCARCDSDLRHQLTLIRRNELLEIQSGRCYCGKVFQVYGGKETTYHVDHDHSCCPMKGRSCGCCVRGLLCNDCNIRLGLAKDKPDLLMDDARYLIGHRDILRPMLAAIA